ncbi:lipopolysaccharide biosynthesis protein [Loktanella salsilacus]|uniref:lipopolysaccharide biosynthesis protein n=1 Tax=Loktanella salsilacus TaxID=195913 RepID=UPI0030F9162A
MTFIVRLLHMLPSPVSARTTDGRTLNYLRQVKLSLVMRLLSVAMSFATTAILLRAMSLEHYGVWSLLISVQAWIGLFDLGIGNGLRTRVAENLAHGRPDEAARLIAIGYLAFTVIFVALATGLVPLVLAVDWQALLNVTSIDTEELRLAVGLTAFLTSMIFVSNLINPVAAAIQKSSYTAVVGVVNATVFTGLALLMYLSGWVSVLTILVAQGVITVSINIGFTIWFYRKQPELTPTPTLNLRGTRDLVSLSGGFFVIQAAMLVLFSTDRFLIVGLLGPQDVPQYDVVFKLFSLFVTIQLMIGGPLWSAYTEAHQRGEYDWISRTIRIQIKVFLLLSAGCIALIFLSKPIINAWTGHTVTFGPGLASLMAVFAVLTMWNNTFGVILNGMGKLRIQLFTATIGAASNIPLSIFFVKVLHFGVFGILLATTLCIALQSLLLPLVVFRIIQEQQRRSRQEKDV